MSSEYEYEDDDINLDDFVIIDNQVTESHNRISQNIIDPTGNARPAINMGTVQQQAKSQLGGGNNMGTGEWEPESSGDGIWAIITDLNKLRKYWFEIFVVISLLLIIWIFGLPWLEYYFRLGKRFLYLLSFFIPVLALWGFNRVNKDRIVSQYNQTRFNKNLRPGSGIRTRNRNVSGNMKKYVAASQEWHCALCGNLLEASYEIDHILPLYRGGFNTIENLQALCPNCHGSKTIRDAIIG